MDIALVRPGDLGQLTATLSGLGEQDAFHVLQREVVLLDLHRCGSEIVEILFIFRAVVIVGNRNHGLYFVDGEIHDSVAGEADLGVLLVFYRVVVGIICQIGIQEVRCCDLTVNHVHHAGVTQQVIRVCIEDVLRGMGCFVAVAAFAFAFSLCLFQGPG